MSDLEIIVKMIIYKCRELGNPVTETLAAYVAQTTLNPNTNKFFLETQMTEDEAKELVEKVITRL